MILTFDTSLFESLSLNNTVLDPTTHDESRWRVTANGVVLIDTLLYGTAGVAAAMAANPDITALSLTSISFEYSDTDALLIEHWHRDNLGVVSDPGEYTFSPCYEGWRVTFFESDDITAILGSSDTNGDVVQGGFHTSVTCPRPFLKWPTGISESEINFQEGRAKIGEMSISIIDKRTDPADQSTGIVTSIIDQLRDARCVVECFYNGEWRVVLNGAVSSFRLGSSFVTWDFNIRDIRERERKFPLFTRNETFAVYPERGAADGYGFSAGAAEPLMPAALPMSGIYTEVADAGARRKGYVQGVAYFDRMDPDTRAMGEPSVSALGLVPEINYPQLTVRWRNTGDAASDCTGSPSTVRVQHMLDTAPAADLDRLEAAYAAANNGDPMPVDPNVLAQAAMGGSDCFPSTPAGARLKNLFLTLTYTYGGATGDWTYLRGSEMKLTGYFGGAGNFFNGADPEIVDIGTIGIPTNFHPQTNLVRVLMEGPDEDMPAPDADIEVQVLAARVTDKTPLVWEGTFGRLLRLCYDGFFSDHAPRIWYDEDRMAWLEANTPIARLNKPKAEDDMRRWVEEHIYKVLGMAPAVDENGRIYPISYQLPPAGAVLPVLDASNTKAEANWEVGDEGGISEVEFVYHREHRVPVITQAEAAEKKTLFGVDWLKRDKVITVDNVSYDIVEKEIRHFFVSGIVENGKRITYKPDTVREVGLLGKPLTRDTMDESGAQLALARKSEVMQRFPNVMPRIPLSCRGSDADVQAVAIGGWARLTMPQLPDPDTRERGCDRIVQVLGLRKPLEDGWARFIVIDGGPYLATIADNLTVDPPPFFDANGVATVTVTAIPAGYVGRIDMATSFTGEPAEDSPDWMPLATNVEATGTYQSPFPVPVDTPVWIRTRIEKAGQQPGDWSAPVLVTGTSTAPVMFSVTGDLDMDTGEVTVSWSHGATAAGMRVYYDVVPDGDTPNLAGTFVDVDATLGEVLLPETVPIGAAAYTVAVKVEPWDTFPIAGTMGTAQRWSTRYPGRNEIPATGGEVDVVAVDLAAEIARATAAEAALAADIAAIGGANVGAGAEVFKDEVASVLRFRTLVAGANITITENADTIEIAGAAGSGEVNTASNVNVGGVGVWKQKTGVDLEFRGIDAGSTKASVALDAATNRILVDVNQANLAIATSQLTGKISYAQLPNGSGTWDIGAGEVLTLPERVVIGNTPDIGGGYDLSLIGGGLLLEGYGVDIYGDSDSLWFGFQNSGGTLAAPAATPNARMLARFFGSGHTGAGWATNGGELRMVASALYTGASTPAHAELWGVAIGSTASTRMAKFAAGGSTIDTALEVTGALTKGGVAVSLAGHTHDADDITTGFLAAERGGTGTTPTAAGDLLVASGADAWTLFPSGGGLRRMLVLNPAGDLEWESVPNVAGSWPTTWVGYDFTNHQFAYYTPASTLSKSLMYRDGSVTNTLSLGAANTVLKVDAAGTSPEYGLLTNANIDAAAAIAWTKLDKTGSSFADFATRSASNIDSGNLPYAQLPTGSGTWNLGAATNEAAITGRLSVSGRMAIGVTATNAVGLRVGAGSVISGGAATQYGVSSNPAFPSSATASGRSIYAQLQTEASVYTMTAGYGVYVDDSVVGAGSAVTTQYGLYIAAQTGGATNWQAYSPSGNSAFGGNTRFGGVAAPTVAVDVTGAVLATTHIRSSGATSGVGYATGAGGTVTQITSKATGVTLNKVTGQITMHGAALAAGAIVSFVLTNSAIAATDALLIYHISAGTMGAYNVWATPGAGSATVYIRNITAGSLSQAIVLQFFVFKLVIA